MKILLFGKDGQVGWELAKSLSAIGEVVSLARKDVDFSDFQSLRAAVKRYQPDVIVNAVAYTAVDRAEEQEELAQVINSDAVSVLAEEAVQTGALLVHFSTDYVFDGCKGSPYVEEDEVHPINVYGKTKLNGEREIVASDCRYLIFRTSWVYTDRGHNFLLTMLKLAREKESISVVNDQLGTPTSAGFISDTVVLCLKKVMVEIGLQSFKSGIYHLVPAGHTSWYGFASEIMRLAQVFESSEFKIKQLLPVGSEQYPTAAKRPQNSILNTEKLQRMYDISVPSWESVLKACVDKGSSL